MLDAISFIIKPIILLILLTSFYVDIVIVYRYLDAVKYFYSPFLRWKPCVGIQSAAIGLSEGSSRAKANSRLVPE